MNGRNDQKHRNCLGWLVLLSAALRRLAGAKVSPRNGTESGGRPRPCDESHMNGAWQDSAFVAGCKGNPLRRWSSAEAAVGYYAPREGRAAGSPAALRPGAAIAPRAALHPRAAVEELAALARSAAIGKRVKGHRAP